MRRRCTLCPLLLAASALACGNRAANYRCILPGGTSATECSSMPADCPRAIAHDDTPRCPSGATLVHKADDHCTHQLICVD